MDIDIVVKERNTGTASSGSRVFKLLRRDSQCAAEPDQLLGRGQTCVHRRISANSIACSSFSFTEPYLFDTKWHAGSDLYIERRYLIPYSELKRGFDIRFGHPLAPYLLAYLKYKLEHTEIDLDPTYGDPDLFPPDTADGTTSSVTLSLEYDKRDDRFAPSKGIFASTRSNMPASVETWIIPKGLANLATTKRFSGTWFGGTT